MFITRFLGGEDLVAHECQDVLTVAIGQPEHLVHVLAAIASVMIKQYMGPTPRTPRIFVHGFQRPELADAKNQGPTGGVDHRKNDSTTNVVLSPDVVPFSIVDAIIRTRTAS